MVAVVVKGALTMVRGRLGKVTLGREATRPTVCALGAMLWSLRYAALVFPRRDWAVKMGRGY